MFALPPDSNNVPRVTLNLNGRGGRIEAVTGKSPATPTPLSRVPPVNVAPSKVSDPPESFRESTVFRTGIPLNPNGSAVEGTCPDSIRGSITTLKFTLLFGYFPEMIKRLSEISSVSKFQ